MSDWISEKAFAKINLALHVLGRRADGYHELDSVVAFVDIADEVSFRVAKSTTISVTGQFANLVPTDSENIIFKAYQVAQEICVSLSKEIPPLEIQLEKNLPVAAGIGGGSADAAAFLRALFRMLAVELTPQKIQSLASKLGADVPVCYAQKPSRMQGIGEIVSALMVSLPPAMVLINPLKPSSTPEIFSKLALNKEQSFKSALNVECAPEWRNDLTEAAIALQPEIKAVLTALEAEPCFSAVRMSGSGATCFGLVSSHATANAAAARLSVRHPKWWVRAASLV